MKIVLDTNVLLISLPTKSKYRPIFDYLINGKFELAISNEIISEYMEIIEQKTNDKHFNILKDIQFPKVNIISIDDFLKEITNAK